MAHHSMCDSGKEGKHRDKRDRMRYTMNHIEEGNERGGRRQRIKPDWLFWGWEKR